ncbi:WAS/WASL-interacting protein family member 2-like [Onychostruthus taczanowskii]|uniref:WAS/WASL-interacting protein family member 2-like n=1 Tax=Onychostruthus taczanowskii TaxID=356909 RepID=UPI001B80326C|nr:WAS/WASL-interacting protein family member 2-like [Onychostruthus taczanowskii]
MGGRAGGPRARILGSPCKGSSCHRLLVSPRGTGGVLAPEPLECHQLLTEGSECHPEEFGGLLVAPGPAQPSCEGPECHHVRVPPRGTRFGGGGSSCKSPPSATSTSCHQEPPECHQPLECHQLLVSPGPRAGEIGGGSWCHQEPPECHRDQPSPVSPGSLSVSHATVGHPPGPAPPEHRDPRISPSRAPGPPSGPPLRHQDSRVSPPPVLVHRHHRTPPRNRDPPPAHRDHQGRGLEGNE